MERMFLFGFMVAILVVSATVTPVTAVDCYVGECGGEVFDPSKDCSIRQQCNFCIVLVNKTSTQFIANHVCGLTSHGDVCSGVLRISNTVNVFDKRCCNQALCWKGNYLLQTRVYPAITTTTTVRPTVDCYVGECGGEVFNPYADCRISANCDFCIVQVSRTSTQFTANHVCGLTSNGDVCGSQYVSSLGVVSEKNCCHQKALCWKGNSLLNFRVSLPSTVRWPRSSASRMPRCMALVFLMAITRLM